MSFGYAFSAEPETFAGECETREEAIAEAINELGRTPEVGSLIYIGSGAPWEAVIHAGRVIEDLQSDAGDECGEPAEDWPGSSHEADAELQVMLQAALDAWLDKHGLRPRFYVVDKVEAVAITAEMLAVSK